MRKLFKKFGKFIAIGAVVLISLILVSAAMTMLSLYADDVSEQATETATHYTYASGESIISALDAYLQKTSFAAGQASTFENTTLLCAYLRQIKNIEGYDNVLLARYYSGDTLYTESGIEYTADDPSRTYRKQYPDQSGFIGIDTDSKVVAGEMEVIGFYVPVTDSDLLDALVLYYPRQEIQTVLKSALLDNAAKFSILTTSTGVVVLGREAIENYDVLGELRKLSGDKTPVDQVEKLLNRAENGVVFFQNQQEDYLVSVYAQAEKLRGLCVVEMYRVGDLAESSFNLIYTIVAIVIIFAVVLFLLVIYLVFIRINMTRALFNLETQDKKLSCLNRHGFELSVEQYLAKNQNSYYAVCVLQLRHFKHLLEFHGDGAVDALLVHIRRVLLRALHIDETFGHVEGGGQFLLLLHAKDRDALVERLKVITFLCTQFDKKQKFDVLVKYGIFEVTKNDKASVTQMIDFANEAVNAHAGTTVVTAAMQMNVYSNELRAIRQQQEEMELRMDTAMKQGEFQVFFQPKFNLKTRKQDGCEALVRWYDPKKDKYNLPALFMELFETNGFVTKLDHYVYTRVCENINYLIAQGRPVFPVSVNVSRVTATQPGFVEFYANTKKKYGIRDGLLTIEFTESFAYENYETLGNIVNTLHKNGFQCSIDDFGCGYSTYRILKALPMDEIKLDRFFLEKGVSEERDTHIFESIIKLGQMLGMKVTQEGVERFEDLQMLSGLGCDVIQGYYYARPLPLTDYINFTADSASHNLSLEKPKAE